MKDRIRRVQTGFFETGFGQGTMDAYPLIRQAIAKPEIYNEEIVRNEMFLHLPVHIDPLPEQLAVLNNISACCEDK
jgi:hypothetical protein